MIVQPLAGDWLNPWFTSASSTVAVRTTPTCVTAWADCALFVCLPVKWVTGGLSSNWQNSCQSQDDNCKTGKRGRFGSVHLQPAQLHSPIIKKKVQTDVQYCYHEKPLIMPLHPPIISPSHPSREFQAEQKFNADASQAVCSVACH